MGTVSQVLSRVFAQFKKYLLFNDFFCNNNNLNNLSKSFSTVEVIWKRQHRTSRKEFYIMRTNTECIVYISSALLSEHENHFKSATPSNISNVSAVTIYLKQLFWNQKLKLLQSAHEITY